MIAVILMADTKGRHKLPSVATRRFEEDVYLEIVRVSESRTGCCLCCYRHIVRLLGPPEVLYKVSWKCPCRHGYFKIGVGK